MLYGRQGIPPRFRWRTAPSFMSCSRVRGATGATGCQAVGLLHVCSSGLSPWGRFSAGGWQLERSRQSVRKGTFNALHAASSTQGSRPRTESAAGDVGRVCAAITVKAPGKGCGCIAVTEGRRAPGDRDPVVPPLSTARLSPTARPSARGLSPPRHLVTASPPCSVSVLELKIINVFQECR